MSDKDEAAPSGATDIKKLRTEAIYHIGDTLLAIQATEHNLNNIAAYLIKTKALRSGSSRRPKSGRNDGRRPTLKNFLDQIRKRTNLYPQFDQQLKEFLALRNTFVHDLREVEGFGFLDDAQLRIAIEFTAKVYALTRHIHQITHSLIECFSDEIELPRDPDPSDPWLRELKQYHDEVDRLFRPHLDHLFFHAKEEG
jgi:hypothetical protein